MFNLKMSEHLDNSENKIVLLQILTFLQKDSHDKVFAEKFKSPVEY